MRSGRAEGEPTNYCATIKPVFKTNAIERTMPSWLNQGNETMSC